MSAEHPPRPRLDGIPFIDEHVGHTASDTRANLDLLGLDVTAETVIRRRFAAGEEEGEKREQDVMV